MRPNFNDFFKHILVFLGYFMSSKKNNLLNIVDKGNQFMRDFFDSNSFEMFVIDQVLDKQKQ